VQYASRGGPTPRTAGRVPPSVAQADFAARWRPEAGPGGVGEGRSVDQIGSAVALKGKPRTRRRRQRKRRHPDLRHQERPQRPLQSRPPHLTYRRCRLHLRQTSPSRTADASDEDDLTAYWNGLPTFKSLKRRSSAKQRTDNSSHVTLPLGIEAGMPCCDLRVPRAIVRKARIKTYSDNLSPTCLSPGSAATRVKLGHDLTDRSNTGLARAWDVVF
jgi:hypothetical protein